MTNRITVTTGKFFLNSTPREINEFFPDVDFIVAVGDCTVFAVPSNFMATGKSFDAFIKAMNESYIKGEQNMNFDYWGVAVRRPGRSFWGDLKNMILDASEDRTHTANRLIF